MRYMRSVSSLFFFALLSHSVGYGQNTITVDIGAEPKPISPYIYGINWVHAGEPLYQDWNLGSRRLGGNRLSNYNWENNASNSGADCEDFCKNENDSWLIYQFPPTEQSIPGVLPLTFHKNSHDMRAYSIVQLQAAGYVAADLNETSRPVPPAPSSRWKEVKFTKGAPFSLDPDPDDDYVYMDEEVNMLVNKLGPAVAGGINAYSIDNEPGLWISTHPRLRGLNYNGGEDVSNADDNNLDPAVKAAKATCVEIAAKGEALAKAVKAVDPTAEIYGPEFWGFLDYYTLQNAVDWPTYSPTYDTYVDMYLDRMQQASDREGKRLLDVLSLHWYPQVDETPQDMLAAPRSLWDPTYKENSWITKDVLGKPIALIPTMRASIDKYFPDTKLAITEFRFGDAENGNTWYSGLAVADALGVFGREGVYAANYHPVNLDEPVEGYVASAYKLYRNYDGLGSTFGNLGLPVTENDNGLSVYASITYGNARNFIDVILINTNATDGASAQGKLRFENVETGSYNFYGGVFFDKTSSQLQPVNPGSPVIQQESPNSFTYLIPSGTAMHLVFEGGVIAGVAEGESTGSENAFSIRPNPVNERATVQLRLNKGGEGSLEIFDQTGRRMLPPINRRFSSGEQTFGFDTSLLPSGAYICKLQCGGELMVSALTVTR